MRDAYLGLLLAIGFLGAVVLAVNADIEQKESARFQGKEDLLVALCNERYDAQQQAKFAGSAKEQGEILETADAISRVFAILDRQGHLKDISPFIRKQIFPLENGATKR